MINKKQIIILICLIVVSIVMIILLNINKKININNLTFEYNQKIKISEILNINNNDYIDTLELGKQSLNIKYKNKHYIINYNVIDKTPPLVLINNSYTYKQGTSVDLVNKILCADNYDKKPNCYIEGEYDFNKIGTYNLKYIAIDSSNNKTEKHFTLNIKKDINSKTSKQEKQNIDDIITKYKTKDTMIGIDVSAWQNNIDFNKVKTSSVDFVMIRIGYGHTKENEIKIDKRFYDNIENAKKNGLKVGIYFYSYAKNVNEVINQADWIINTLKGESLDLPIAFDFEDWNNFNSYNLSLTDLNQIADTFIKRIESYGYQSMLYGSYYYLNNIWETENKKIWLAHYASKTDYNNKYMWQLTNKGKVNGIENDVDINILYK